MFVKIDLTGLNNFKKRLENISTQTLAEKIVKALCEYGANYAQGMYSGESITVTAENVSSVGGSIIAKDSKGEKATIGYLEFGTGVKGEGSYKGTLPTQNINFVSPSYGQITTNGWQYYYAYQQGLSQKQWQGSQAKSQMWNTAKYLRENAVAIINQVLGANK